MSRTALVIFAFNRPHHLRTTLDALAGNPGVDELDLHIFCDGPRSDEDIKAVSDVLKVCQAASGFGPMTIHSAPMNVGLAESVIAGMNAVFAEYERAIVFEDDIVSHPRAVEFLTTALDFYENYPRVFSLSAYSLGRDKLAIPKDYRYSSFFSHRGSSWGWASWRRSWEKTVWELDYVDDLLNDSFRRRSFSEAGTDLEVLLRRQRAGTIDSWAIRFHYSMFRQGGCCLFPIDSLVKNIGFDSLATHKKGGRRFDVELHAEDGDFVFAPEVFVDSKLSASYATGHGDSPLRKLKRVLEGHTPLRISRAR